MDDLTAQLVEFSTQLRFGDLPANVVDATCVRYADSVACALAALDAPPVVAAAKVAPRVCDGVGVSPLGRSREELVSADMASFLNTTRIRYLDYNDWAPNAHPSDCLGGLLASPDAGVSGRGLVTAAVVAYEVSIGLTEAMGLARRGWDQGFSVGVGTVAALGNLLRLDRRTLANAIGIIASSGIPLGATRSGMLSMWKACATAYATRNAMFAVQLACAGVTGPLEGFDGRRGVKEVVAGPFRLALADERAFRILRTSMKYWPVCYHAQAPAWAAHQLRFAVDCRDIATVRVETYAEAWRSTGSEPEKWAPASRETADHSTPWVVATVLTHGKISGESFCPDAFADPAITELMKRISVEPSDWATEVFPQRVAARLVVTDRHGGEHRAEVVNPTGHPDNPMTDQDLHEKFRSLVAPVLGDEDRVAEAFATWRRLGDGTVALGAALDTVVVPRSQHV